MEEPHRLSVKDYTVGWISALAIEQSAATVMLDEEHPLPHDFQSDTGDDNLYTFGRIGNNNIVLTCLSSGRYGTNSAAWTAAHLSNRFPYIRAGLLVGIGGGVPSDNVDIRLGDVAVSLPNGQVSGVVQYDLGKQIEGGLQRTGYLNSPPPLLLNAIAQLRAHEILGQNLVSQHLSVFDLLPQSPFSREKAGADVLYGEDGNPKLRTPRPSSDPVCHYGTIASGNQVVKDSKYRDLISQKLGGIICLEMEAAGIMNNFPSVVIRGICDYADSHKNKEWQPYAAASAAAYAKSLISIIPPTNMERARESSENIEDSPYLILKQSKGSKDIEAEDSLELHGGPRRGDKKKSVRGVIGNTEVDPASDASVLEEALTKQKEVQSRILERLGALPKSRPSFSLIDRTINFYGEVYLGNGTVMRSIINNKGGTIRNSGGPMNLVGNVGGSIHSGNSVTRGVRGYATRAYQSFPGLQPLRRALNLPLFKLFRGRR